MKIYYVVETDFARKNAACVRILGCSKAIEYESDNKVTIIGFSNTTKIEDDGFEIFNVKRGHSFISKVFNTLTRPAQFMSKIKSLDKPDVIIYYAIYGNSVPILKSLKKYCKRNNIKLLVDITEWYEYKLLPGGENGIKAKDVKKAITELIPRCDGVIAISSYLENYFKGRGVNVIRVPIIVDTAATHTAEPSQYFDHKALNLLFAGSIGSKELIIKVARQVKILHEEGHAIKLNILGVDKQTFTQISNLTDSQAIVCHGRIEQSKVEFYLRSADFSVLIRPDILNTRAGFPTKFVESLNAGLPVIANLTSDIGDYLIDGKNGLVVCDSSHEAIKETLMKALAIDKERLTAMKTDAKQTAIDNFDFKLYSESIKLFIKQC